MLKDRFTISDGLQAKESSWRLGPCMVDFSGTVFAGATTERQIALVLPVTTGSHKIKSPDTYPTEDGRVLTAITNGRQVSTGSATFAELTGVFVAHITAAGAVYSPAGTTVQVKVSSTFGANVGAAVNLTGAFNVTAATNGIDPVTITAPADRQLSIEGVADATVALLFNGDVLFVELVTTGALTVDPNLLAVYLEVS